MDYDTIDAVSFGLSLKGLGINILVRDVKRTSNALVELFEMQAYQPSADFAIIRYANQVFQLHADHTYHSHPLPSLLPEYGPRGGGIELRLYETDPDDLVARLREAQHDWTVLQEPTDKPHGLRECVVVCPDGYAWLPSRRLTQAESAALESD